MPALLSRFRLRNKADDDDLIVATSVRDGIHPYIEAFPDGDGQEVDPLTGKVTVGSYRLRVIDWWGLIPGIQEIPLDWIMYTEDVAVSASCQVGDATDECLWESGKVGWRSTIRLPYATTSWPESWDDYRAVLDGNCWNMSIGQANGAFYAEAQITGLPPNTQFEYTCQAQRVETGGGTISSNVLIGIWWAYGSGGGSRDILQGAPEVGPVNFVTQSELNDGTVANLICRPFTDANGQFWIKMGCWSVEVGEVCFATHFWDMQLTVEVEDTRGRIVTSVLNDATMRPQFMGHRAYIEESEDGAAWTTRFAGYCTRATLDTALSWDFELGDSDRVEQGVTLWSNGDTTPANTYPSALLGGPVEGGWGPLADRGLTRMRVAFVEADEFVTLDYVSGPLPITSDGGVLSQVFNALRSLGYINTMMEGYATRVSGDQEPALVGDDRYYVFPQWMCEVYSVSTGALVGTFMPISRSKPLPSFIDPDREPTAKWWMDETFTGAVRWTGAGLDQRGVTQPAQPSVNAQYHVRLYLDFATDLSPFHFEGHPVDLAAAIFDVCGLPYSASSAVNTKNALGPNLTIRLRPREPTKAYTVLTEWLAGPHGFAWRINSDGEREFYSTRLPQGTTPATTVDLDTLATEGTPYDLAEQSIANVVVWNQEQYAIYVPSEDNPLTSRPIDGLYQAKLTIRFKSTDLGADDTTFDAGREHAIEYTYPGHLEEAPTSADLPYPILAGRSQEVFLRYGRGGPEITLPCLAAMTEPVGEYVVLDLDYLPRPDAGAFPLTYRPKDYPLLPSRQLGMITKRTEVVGGSECRFAWIGPLSEDFDALPVPTLSIAASAVDPKNAAVVTITNASSLNDALDVNRVRLEYGIGTSEPSAWNLLTYVDPGTLSTVVTPLVNGGSHLWVRARVETTTGLVGAWSDVEDVDLADLVAPSSLTATALASNQWRLAWTNGEAGLAVIVEAKRSADSAYTLVAALPPGSTQTTFTAAAVSTTYNLRVYHKEDPPLSGTSGAATVDVTSGATLPQLDPPYLPHIGSGGGAIRLCVYVGASDANTVMELATETAPGSGIYGNEEEILMASGAAIHSVVCGFAGPVADDGLTYRVRAKHTRVGYTDSEWTSSRIVNPWQNVNEEPPARYREEQLYNDAGATLLNDDGDGLVGVIPLF